METEPYWKIVSIETSGDASYVVKEHPIQSGIIILTEVRWNGHLAITSVFVPRRKPNEPFSTQK